MPAAAARGPPPGTAPRRTIAPATTLAFHCQHDLVEVIPLLGAGEIGIHGDAPGAGVRVAVADAPAVAHAAVAELPAPGAVQRRRDQDASQGAPILGQRDGPAGATLLAVARAIAPVMTRYRQRGM